VPSAGAIALERFGDSLLLLTTTGELWVYDLKDLPLFYNVKVIVEDNLGNKLPGARLIIGGIQKIADSNGEVEYYGADALLEGSNTWSAIASDGIDSYGGSGSKNIIENSEITLKLDITTSLEANYVEDFIIYPSPAEHLVNVAGVYGNLTCYDILGNVILETRVDGAAQIDVQNWLRGTYLFSISGKTKRVVIK
jgi:hypothetical protein